MFMLIKAAHEQGNAIPTTDRPFLKNACYTDQLGLNTRLKKKKDASGTISIVVGNAKHQAGRSMHRFDEDINWIAFSNG